MKLTDIVDQLQQETGALRGEPTKNKTYTSERVLATEALANEAFAHAVDRLYHVAAWSDISSITADFTPYDATGKPAPTSPVQVGDFICIAFPGPMPENWVHVIDASTTNTSASFTVQPCADPTGDNPGQIAHFFGPEARSTFRVDVAGTTLRAAEIGQHEGVNNQQPEAGDRALLNTIIAEAGWLFYQKIQWQKVTDYLVGV